MGTEAEMSAHVVDINWRKKSLKGYSIWELL